MFFSQFDMLELDKLEKMLQPCSLLLDPNSYLPDTVDLTTDTAAREYWIDCFSNSVDKVCKNTEKAFSKIFDSLYPLNLNSYKI